MHFGIQCEHQTFKWYGETHKIVYQRNKKVVEATSKLEETVRAGDS